MKRDVLKQKLSKVLDEETDRSGTYFSIPWYFCSLAGESRLLVWKSRMWPWSFKFTIHFFQDIFCMCSRSVCNEVWHLKQRRSVTVAHRSYWLPLFSFHGHKFYFTVGMWPGRPFAFLTRSLLLWCICICGVFGTYCAHLFRVTIPTAHDGREGWLNDTEYQECYGTIT